MRFTLGLLFGRMPIWAFCLGLLSGASFLAYGLYGPDNRPRHVRETMGSIVLRDYWTTNRYSVSDVASNVLTSNGYRTEIIFVTNRLW